MVIEDAQWRTAIDNARRRLMVLHDEASGGNSPTKQGAYWDALRVVEEEIFAVIFPPAAGVVEGDRRWGVDQGGAGTVLLGDDAMQAEDTPVDDQPFDSRAVGDLALQRAASDRAAKRSKKGDTAAE